MKTEVMGILNVTPDSFSDGGKLGTVNSPINVANKNGIFVPDMDKVLFRVQEMINEGADIIDVGGESTRPGYTVVEAHEELERVIPVITNIKKNFDIKVSLDTYKGKVAEEGIKAGVDIINDIGMLSMDDEMLKVISRYDIPYILMHNKEGYKDLKAELLEMVDLAVSNGTKRSNIILDPGIGFNKSHEQNLMEIKNLPDLCKLGYPVLLGASNKRVVGNALNLPVDERLEGTMALSVMAVMAGVKYVRVHNVKSNVRAIRMAEAVIYS